MSQSGIYIVSRLVFYVVFFIGLIVSVTSIGIDFTAFAVIAGALSVGIGFGLQAIVSNFIAGLIVLFEKTVRLGDIIELESGQVGVVQEVNVRTTLLRTFDGLEVFVPNSEIVLKKFTNWTLSTHQRRWRIPFSVAYGTDKRHLREVLLEAINKEPTTLKTPAANIFLTGFGDNGLDFTLGVWVDDKAKGAAPVYPVARYNWVIEDTLAKHNIEIPNPVRDVRTQK